MLGYKKEKKEEDMANTALSAALSCVCTLSRSVTLKRSVHGGWRVRYTLQSENVNTEENTGKLY
jgi:hypothetical protein